MNLNAQRDRYLRPAMLISEAIYHYNQTTYGHAKIFLSTQRFLL